MGCCSNQTKRCRWAEVWRSRNASYRFLGQEYTAWQATFQAQKTLNCAWGLLNSRHDFAVACCRRWSERDKEETSVGQPGELVAPARGTGSRPVLVQIFFLFMATEGQVGKLHSPSSQEWKWKSPPSFSLRHGAQSFSSRVSARRRAKCMDFSKPQIVISLPDAATENAGTGFWKMQRTNSLISKNLRAGSTLFATVHNSSSAFALACPTCAVGHFAASSVVPSRFSLIVCTSPQFARLQR